MRATPWRANPPMYGAGSGFSRKPNLEDVRDSAVCASDVCLKRGRRDRKTRHPRRDRLDQYAPRSG
jgi:hypothetical protein